MGLKKCHILSGMTSYFLCKCEREDGGKENMTPFFLLFSSYDTGGFIPGNLVKMHRSSPSTHPQLLTNIFQRDLRTWKGSQQIFPLHLILSGSCRFYPRCVPYSINTIGIFWEQPESHSFITLQPYIAKFWLWLTQRDMVIESNKMCSL